MLNYYQCIDFTDVDYRRSEWQQINVLLTSGSRVLQVAGGATFAFGSVIVNKRWVKSTEGCS